MSQLLIQQQKQLTKPSEILKSDYAKKFQKIKYELSEGKLTNKRCALGVIYSYLGWDGDIIGDEARHHFISYADKLYENNMSLHNIAMMNNTTDMTFYEIGCKLEEMGS